MVEESHECWHSTKINMMWSINNRATLVSVNVTFEYADYAIFQNHGDNIKHDGNLHYIGALERRAFRQAICHAALICRASCNNWMAKIKQRKCTSGRHLFCWTCKAQECCTLSRCLWILGSECRLFARCCRRKGCLQGCNQMGKLKGRAMAACVVDITIWTGSICARSTILAPGN